MYSTSDAFGHVEPFLPPTRAIFQPLWGKTRVERGECLSISTLPLEAAVSQNEVYHRRCWLVLGARRCDFKARPISARDIPSKSGKRSSRVLALCSSSITFLKGFKGIPCTFDHPKLWQHSRCPLRETKSQSFQALTGPKRFRPSKMKAGFTMTP